MECFAVNPTDIKEEIRQFTLRGDEAHHAVKSLRLRVGDELLASNLVGTVYKGRILHIVDEKREQCVDCEILEVLHQLGESLLNVVLIQGILNQPSRWEILLEKSVELGVRAIWPVTTARSEAHGIRIERSERILFAAVKQTKRANKPWLRELSTLREALSVAVKDNRTILFFDESIGSSDAIPAFEPYSSIAIVIGPEGGFSSEERELASECGARIVSLGSRRLRAETAAIAALARIIRD